MPNTKAVTDKIERKKIKRVMRKKAEVAKPKPKRTHARGEAKRKVKKMVRGQSKR
ncbi:MAG: hypothetical protein ABSD96_16410 [Candidatus Korobacteraceae bacterium]|jgi:hypothetical protein